MKKYPSLDGLRGIAILLVFAYHYGSGGVNSHSLVTRIFGTLCGFGWSGVDLFFVLSGFLITGILWDTRTDEGYYKKFYARRALRIFPVFYAFAFVMFLVGHNWKPIHLSLLFYVGWPVALIWPAQIATTLGIAHLWSLAAEEQFYVIWPLLIKRIRKPLVLCALCIVGGLLLRAFVILFCKNYWYWAYFFMPSRVDSLAVGAGIALLMRAGYDVKRFAPQVLGASIASLAIMFAVRYTTDHFDAIVATLGYSVLAFGSGALLLVSLDHPKFFSLSILKTFGKYSYGFYLFHFPLMALFEPLKLKLHFAYVPTVLLLNLGIAAMSFHLLEQPLLNLKKYFAYDQKRPIGRFRDISGSSQLLQPSLSDS